MISDKDIYRSAQVLINQYGDEGEALLEAMRRIELYRKKDNASGMRVWNRIADAIGFLTMPENLTSETVQ